MATRPLGSQQCQEGPGPVVGESMRLRAARGKIALSGFVALLAAATSAVGLVAAPAGAAPSTKNYTASVGDTAATGASVTYPTSSPTTPTTQTLFVTLANSLNSNQSF